MLQAVSAHLQPFVERLTSRSLLAETERLAILGLPGRLVHAPPHVDLVTTFGETDHACYVVDGLVARFDNVANGRRSITALHIPGEIPDLHAIVLPSTSSALHPLTPATILLIPQAAMRAVATAHPAVAKAFWQSCMVDARILGQRIVNVGHRSARCRIAHLLCEMAVRYRGNQLVGKVVYNLPMSQGHLAAATGLTSVHVSRSLKALKSDGVEFRGGTVYIADWNKLVQASRFDVSYLL